MKKILPVIIGFFIGLLATFVVVLSNFGLTAYGEGVGEAWNDLVAKADTLDWSEVLGADDPGKDLYAFLYNDFAVAPKEDALAAVGGNLGLTPDEVQAVVNGSIIPIYNNPDRKSAELTQEDAYKIMKGIQEDYADLKEIFEIERSVMATINPGELFANGDKSDSGFDLIDDLTVIEEILFLDTTELSVGAPFENALDSPYNPTEDDKFLSDYVKPKAPVAVLPLTVKEKEKENDDDLGVLRSAATGEAVGNKVLEKVGVLNVGDNQFEVEILEEDVCRAEDSLDKALEEFEKEKEKEDSKAVATADDDGNSSLGAQSDGLSEGAGGNKNNSGKATVGGLNENGQAVAAEPGVWGSPWCPGLSAGTSGAGAGVAGGGSGGKSVGVGPGGIKSIGGNQTDSLYAGAGTSFESTGFSAEIGLCIDIQAIKGTVSSYQPGSSCVKCEIEKINDLLNETLSKSLVPNKATGNIMESGKCKDTGSLFNMQFITLWAPIPTPANDKLIYGKNIYEEWNKFIERYTPLSPLKSTEDKYSEPEEAFKLQSDSLPAGTTQAEAAKKVGKTISQYKAEALKEVENYQDANDAANILLYSRNVLMEIRQMNNMFKNFKANFIKISTKPIPEINKKPDKG